MVGTWTWIGIGDRPVIVHDWQCWTANASAKPCVVRRRSCDDARVVVKRVFVPWLLVAHAHATPRVVVHVVVVVVVVSAKVVLEPSRRKREHVVVSVVVPFDVGHSDSGGQTE